MKNNIRIILTIFSLLTLSLSYSCTSSRSATGLEGGDVNFSYIAPAAASFRIGVTDNIETRILVLGVTKLSTDLFLHTHQDSSLFNYGISFGSRFDHRIFGKKSDDKPTFYSTFTISRKIKRFTPYLSFSYDTDKEVGNSLTLGTEYKLYHNRRSDFLIFLIPELNYYFTSKDIIFENGNKTNFGGSIGIGFLFNLF